jgi:hypothetical protein
LPTEILPCSVFFRNINPQLATMDLRNCWPWAKWMGLDTWQRRDFFSQKHVQTSSGNRYGTKAHKRPCFRIPQIHGIHSTRVNQSEHNADPNSYSAKVTTVSYHVHLSDVVFSTQTLPHVFHTWNNSSIQQFHILNYS